MPIYQQQSTECTHPHGDVGPCERCAGSKRGVATLLRQHASITQPGRKGPEPDDVLDLYSLMSEETGKDMLLDMCKLFPQYDAELRQFAAFKEVGKWADTQNDG